MVMDTMADFNGKSMDAMVDMTRHVLIYSGFQEWPFLGGEPMKIRLPKFAASSKQALPDGPSRDQELPMHVVVTSLRDERYGFFSKPDLEFRVVMMRNIPCRCTKDDLFAAIEDLGFKDAYDFFHLPLKRHCQRQNNGYAFIGFSTAEAAKTFCDKAEGYRFPCRNSAKAVTLVPARMQDLDEIFEHFKEKKVLQTNCPPVFNT